MARTRWTTARRCSTCLEECATFCDAPVKGTGWMVEERRLIRLPFPGATWEVLSSLSSFPPLHRIPSSLCRVPPSHMRFLLLLTVEVAVGDRQRL